MTQPSRLQWTRARVVELIVETARVTSIVLELTDWPGHQAGQHVEVRLARGAPARRSFWIASAPEDGYLMLTVQRIAGDQLSVGLVDDLDVGDLIELRGPFGGALVWQPSPGSPLLLFAGGSGIVPLRSMLRHRAAAADPTPVRLLYSARSLDDVIYREELLRISAYDEIDVRLALTRAWPARWAGHRGRIDHALLMKVAWPADEQPLVYACGPSSFVETVSALLVASGHDPRRIRTERFGPTGA